MVLRGVVYMTKSSGPRTEPWGTPQKDVYLEDRSYKPKLPVLSPKENRARHYAIVVCLCLCVCLSVRHKSVLYHNDWTNRVGFWHSFHHKSTCHTL